MAIQCAQSPMVGRILRKTCAFYKEMSSKDLEPELPTALEEIEMVLNSRPLTYVSSEDFEEPLTP